MPTRLHVWKKILTFWSCQQLVSGLLTSLYAQVMNPKPYVWKVQIY